MTLITKKGFCPACLMTEKVLKHKGIDYTVKHLEGKTDEQTIALRNHIRDLGIRQYPIVEPHDKLDSSAFWGFHPEKLNA